MFVNRFLMFFYNFFVLDIKIALAPFRIEGLFCLIVKQSVAFVKRGATIVNETQVCNFKCTVCKRNASFVSEMHYL